MKRYADVVSGGMVALFGLVMLIETRSIQALMPMDFGPKIMPRIFAICLILLGTIISVTGVIKFKNDPSSVQSTRLGTLGKYELMKISITLGLIVFYVFSLRNLGFILTSIIYLFFQILILGAKPNNKKLIVYVTVSLFFSIAIFYLFTGVFNVFLPVGRIW